MNEKEETGTFEREIDGTIYTLIYVIKEGGKTA